MEKNTSDAVSGNTERGECMITINHNDYAELCTNCPHRQTTYRGTTYHTGDDPAEYSCPLEMTPALYVIDNTYIECAYKMANGGL
jgi:hypothetical protein